MKFVENQHIEYEQKVASKFISNGSLPQGLSEEEFFEGFSILRNKELMRIFKDLDLVEQLGSGIPRILESYDKDSFHFSENFLRVVFPKNIVESRDSNQDGNQDSNQDGNQESNQEATPYSTMIEKILASDKARKILEEGFLLKEKRISSKTFEKYYEQAKELEENEIKILDYCLSPKNRREILEDCLGISNQTKNFRNNVEPLLDKGLVTRTIKDRPTSRFQKYFTTNKGRAFLYLATYNE